MASFSVQPKDAHLPISATANSASSARPVVASVKVDTSKSGNSKWKHFIAGGIGGMIGATLTCPLEVIKTALQSKAYAADSAGARGILSVANSIAKTDGIRGFWKGLGPMLVGVVPARATYFTAYDAAKSFLNQHRPESSSTHLLSAMAAGATTNFMINPVWVRSVY